MLYRRTILAALMAGLALTGAACAQDPAVDVNGRPLEALTIVTASGSHDFLVEIADTEPLRQRGLMHRPPLADDRGMLFTWPGETAQERGFWMHNTPSSLDIIYVGDDGRITSIIRRATPNSDAILPSRGPAKGVVELRAGRADEIGAKAGGSARRARAFPVGR